MRPVTVLLLAGAGIASLCASGCFGPMYNPYGAWGAPGYSNYNNPSYGYPAGGGTFQTLTPGSQYVPGGTNGTGGSASPTPTYDGGGNATPWGGGSNVPVPNPQDPGNPYFPNPNDTYSQPRSGASAAPASDAAPFSAAESRGDEALFSQTSGGTPTRPLNGPEIRPTGMTRLNADREVPNYSFDEAEYAWLEGVVSYDPADATWNIVYDLDPGASDEFAGHFTLSNTPLQGTFREGEAVRIEGRVDPVDRDRFGKPTYLPERVVRTAV